VFAFFRRRPRGRHAASPGARRQRGRHALRPAAVPAVPAAAPSGPRVGLVFADGAEVRLDRDSEFARAFGDVAAVLVSRG
jgi:hypothetical protein